MEEQEQIEQVETVENSAAPQESAPVEQAPAAETVAPVENQEANPNEVVGKGTTQKPQYTDLEKAQYSFHKQFSKQKAKYEKQIAERDEQLKQFAERLEKLENPDKYRPKYRDDFKTDDEFINHLVEQRFNAQWEKTLQEYQKQETERQQREETEKQYRAHADENAKRLFTTEESLADYHEKVNEAIDAGLGNLIESDMDLAHYIILSPIGPKIMYELATNDSAVEALFGQGVTPIARQFKIREMESKLAAQPAPAPVAPAQATVQTQTPPVKPAVVGQPGKTTGAPPRDIFHDKEAMREFLRR